MHQLETLLIAEQERQLATAAQKNIHIRSGKSKIQTIPHTVASSNEDSDLLLINLIESLSKDDGNGIDNARKQ